MAGNISIIVAAGGEGRRMKSALPKVFLPLAGKLILVRSLEAFQGIPGIREIVLVLPPRQIEWALARYGRLFSRLGVKKLVSGGKTRRESVSFGLEMVDRNSRIVVVHDAARPLVSEKEVRAVIREARKSGAALLGAPARDTMKEVDARRRVLRTPDRARMWHALTPQAFRADLLREAHRKVRGKATDDAQMVEKLGHRVIVVKGNSHNLKITTPEDMRIAEALLSVPRSRKGRKKGR